MRQIPPYFIEFDRRAPVARIKLNRPPHNLMNIVMISELNTALTNLLSEANCRALVISGANEAFSAGLDLADHTPEKVDTLIKTFHRTFHILNEFEIPTLAVVDGPALGGGCEVASFCDFVIASREATFGQPEIKMGVFPPVACATLSRICGPRRALELILTGDVLSAEEAKQIGLITKIVDRDQLNDETSRFLDRILVNSSAVVRMARKAVRASRGIPFAGKLDTAEGIYLHELLKLQDAHEGLSAHLEKRKPVWKNK